MASGEADDERFVEVPPEELPSEVLRALLEEFVTRDGTDYGASERGLDEKVADVERQLARGEVRIVFDVEEETVNVVTTR